MDKEDMPVANGGRDPTRSAVEGVLSFTPTPLQKRIIDIAVALMEDHYTLDTERLHKACIRAIKDSDVSAIDAALSDLYYKRVLVGGKAITKLSVLDNQNRGEIYTLIKRRPGINAARIQQALGLSFGTIAWHLKMLAKFKLIRIELVNEAMTCFDISVDKRLDAALVVLQKKLMAEILALFLQSRSLRTSEIMARIGIPRTTLARKLKELEAVGLLTREGGGDAESTMCIPQAHLYLVEQAVRR